MYAQYNILCQFGLFVTSLPTHISINSQQFPVGIVSQQEEEKQDSIEAMDEDEQEQDDIQVVNKEEYEEHEQDKGCSGSTKKRRQFTLEEKLMYLWVILQKVDKGLSLLEASKLINISLKQILDWKKQAGTMKNKNNQQAKSFGDGVTSFLSLYTDNLLFYF